MTATAKAVAATWAAGRYADSVCRLRRAGADWLPAPLAQALEPGAGEAAALERGGAQPGALPPLRAGDLRVAGGSPPCRRTRARARSRRDAKPGRRSAARLSNGGRRPPCSRRTDGSRRGSPG